MRHRSGGPGHSWLALALVLAGSVPARAGTSGCRVLAVVGLADEARVAAGPGVEVVVSAADAGLLEERLDRVDPTELAAVVSFGIAGALDETLRVGDLCVATQVVSGGRSWQADERMRRTLRSRLEGAGGPGYVETVFLGNDELTGASAEENRLLHRESGAGVVDMESHRAAEFAARNRLPFAAIRAISDSAGQTLPPAVTLPLRPDGSGNALAVLKSVIAQPSQLPDLWTMVKGFRAAMATLRAVRERVGLADLAPSSGSCGGSEAPGAPASE